MRQAHVAIGVDLLEDLGGDAALDKGVAPAAELERGGEARHAPDRRGESTYCEEKVDACYGPHDRRGCEVAQADRCAADGSPIDGVDEGPALDERGVRHADDHDRRRHAECLGQLIDLARLSA